VAATLPWTTKAPVMSPLTSTPTAFLPVAATPPLTVTLPVTGPATRTAVGVVAE
jgi:hypothetical protein